MPRILIIEDDPAIQRGLEASFRQEHYDVTLMDDGAKGYTIALQQQFDIILLDLVLPSRDGEDVCRGLREENISTPILMLTSKRGEAETVAGLELGADDYMTKPFSLPELHARVRALLRRSKDVRKEPVDFTFGSVHVDFKRREIMRSGSPQKMSQREFDVLKFFIMHEGEIVTRDMLLDSVWGYDVFPTTRTVDNFILSIRKKIEEDFSVPKHLLTIHAAGYRFLKGDPRSEAAERQL